MGAELPPSESSPTYLLLNHSRPSGVQAKLVLLAAAIEQLTEQHPFLSRFFLALRILAAFALVLFSVCLAWVLAWKTVLRHVGFIQDIVHGILGIKKPPKKRQTYVRKSGGAGGVGLAAVSDSEVRGAGEEAALKAVEATHAREPSQTAGFAGGGLGNRTSLTAEALHKRSVNLSPG